MKRLARFLGLPSSDKRLLLQAWLQLSAATLRLRLLSHRKNRGWIQAPCPELPEAPDAIAERIRWAVTVASRYVPGCRCLPQALTARKLLADLGYGSTLRIGVRKEQQEMEAHAWLESNGRTLVGAIAPQRGSDPPLWSVLNAPARDREASTK